MIIEALLILGIVVGSLLWHFQAKRRRRARARDREHMLHTMGLEVLANRYARGEISRDEYLQKRSDILGYPPTSPQSIPSHAA